MTVSSLLNITRGVHDVSLWNLGLFVYLIASDSKRLTLGRWSRHDHDDHFPLGSLLYSERRARQRARACLGNNELL